MQWTKPDGSSPPAACGLIAASFELKFGAFLSAGKLCDTPEGHPNLRMTLFLLKNYKSLQYLGLVLYGQAVSI